VRFLVGGTIVSLFALIGDLLKPKGFAGLFGTVPSVALATLSHGKSHHQGVQPLAGCEILGIYGEWRKAASKSLLRSPGCYVARAENRPFLYNDHAG
jgi:hypothetical protein